MKIKKAELKTKLDLHLKWLRGEVGGERANLYGANLSGADLYGANLHGADLYGANLHGANLSVTNLYGANLSGADLRGANLYGANLYGANLYGANLYGANLYGANLYGANLSGANIDFSCWPLWCGSKSVKIDIKIAAQLAAHFCSVECDDKVYQKAKKAIMPLALKSHRAGELGLEEQVP